MASDTPSRSTTSETVGISFTGLLTIVFIVLKLCGVIAWSWWWVLAPLWIAPALGLVIVVIVVILAVIGRLDY